MCTPKQRDAGYFSGSLFDLPQSRKVAVSIRHWVRLLLHKCVGCHMPLRESAVIAFDAGGHRVNPQVRSHRIAIYERTTR